MVLEFVVFNKIMRNDKKMTDKCKSAVDKYVCHPSNTIYANCKLST